jgi:hypothetical protein
MPSDTNYGGRVHLRPESLMNIAILLKEILSKSGLTVQSQLLLNLVISIDGRFITKNMNSYHMNSTNQN